MESNNFRILSPKVHMTHPTAPLFLTKSKIGVQQPQFVKVRSTAQLTPSKPQQLPALMPQQLEKRHFNLQFKQLALTQPDLDCTLSPTLNPAKFNNTAITQNQPLTNRVIRSDFSYLQNHAKQLEQQRQIQIELEKLYYNIKLAKQNQQQFSFNSQFNQSFINPLGSDLGIINRFTERIDQPDIDKVYDDDEPISVSNNLATAKQNAKQAKSKFNPDHMFSTSLKLRYEFIQLDSTADTSKPALFTIKTSSYKEEERVPLDLICVLDTSSSMEGEKIELLVKTLGSLVGLLNGNDRISIVSFNDYGERLIPLQRVTQANKPLIIKAVKSLKADGCTDITDGMRIALRILNERRYKNPVSSVFLLSDGLDKKAISGVKALLDAQESNDNFTIHSFGYGNDHDPELMSTIAKYKDGNFYFVEELETVEECFADALGGLISVVGQDVSINIEPVKSDIFPNLEIKKAFGGEDLWETRNGSYNTKISQLSAGKSKNYVFELNIPKTLTMVSE